MAMLMVDAAQQAGRQNMKLVLVVQGSLQVQLLTLWTTLSRW